VELELPLKVRLEAIDAQHRDTAALLRRPLVPTAVKNEQEGPRTQGEAGKTAGAASRERTAMARKLDRWAGKDDTFTSIGDLPYTTCVQVV
jgi:hypothetical protein